MLCKEHLHLIGRSCYAEGPPVLVLGFRVQGNPKP